MREMGMASSRRTLPVEPYIAPACANPAGQQHQFRVTPLASVAFIQPPILKAGGGGHGSHLAALKTVEMIGPDGVQHVGVTGERVFELAECVRADAAC